MGVAPFHLNREALTSILSSVMEGSYPGADELPLRQTSGPLKTYALEVHADSDGAPSERAQRLAGRFGMHIGETFDSTLSVMWNDGITLFVDSLDPRFWLLHTASPAAKVRSLIGHAVWRSRDLDWCWFPAQLVRSMAAEGDLKWFKSDFRGDELLPVEGTAARRMRVQLEGDDPVDLLEQLARTPKYQRAVALSSLALALPNGRSGPVQESAHYRGTFVARGDSFETHVGFVSRAVQRYSKIVEDVEARFPFRWDASPELGATFTGDAVHIEFSQAVPSLEKFAEGLFSCRDPFRLWAVPKWIGDAWIEAEAVDLHVGTRVRMDLTPDYIRMYLPDDACGNTIVRLIANLQHRYDATVPPTLAIESDQHV